MVEMEARLEIDEGVLVLQPTGRPSGGGAAEVGWRRLDAQKERRRRIDISSHI
jgi:hypothetical protein